ncbi:MAG: hypothetical protein US30_C0008G0048 [Candidatus Moranbacteria bacterium GW2011_GWF2_36_839]|nr:MAG: hypothetical protein US27_C0008G0048 [Candidatus Moranbacteria bacterium GW2011_GWF1_36_78]KKQ17030.1 MAG: hypothetical protein US30_C0008G0048 [Candidatus Moranbacteria bacterium GW2011_GWF2_36_839]HAT74040.1 hypothetical protein [Candidatus Moranbacteria bacterium]HBY11204.1 hypothetical protein [Candidatus Moranbacteria bacterium]
MTEKIIHFDFNSGKKIEKPELRESVINRNIDNTRHEVKNEDISPKERGDALTSKIEKIYKLKTDPGKVKQCEEEVIKDWDANQLLDWLERSTELDWNRKPALYNAIAHKFLLLYKAESDEE